MSGTVTANSSTITSANSIVTLRIPGLFNNPITLTNFGADRAFEGEVVEFAETSMSVDGYLNAGYIPNPFNQTYTLSPASTFWVPLETLISAIQTGQTSYRLSGQIVLPSIGRKYAMINGVLLSGHVMPNAGRVLDARAFTVRWQSASASVL